MIITQANCSTHNVVVTITTQQQIHISMPNEEINGKKKKKKISTQLVVKDNWLIRLDHTLHVQLSL